VEHTQSSKLLENLSTLLLELYEARDTVQFPEFQRAALMVVEKKLPFDSAIWGSGALATGKEPAGFSIYVHGLPEEEWRASYERVRDRDFTLASALGQPGITANVAVPDRVWADGDAEVRAYVERFGFQHTLLTVTRGPVTGLLDYIGIFRADPKNAFSEDERLLQQNLVPHLVAFCDRSRMHHLERALHPDRRRWSPAAALVDKRGVLCSANSGFVTLMLSEWPDWRGPLLPGALIEVISAGHSTRTLFSRIAVHISAVNDLILLYLREIAPSDRLSQREWDVACAFGRGMSYKEIARQFGIAPGTVRNHLSAVYGKLNISNKAELAHNLKTASR